MLGVWFTTVNLSASPRLFDITMKELHYSTGYVLTNSIDIPLVTCTPEHLNFNAQLNSIQDKFHIANGLCPNIGQPLTAKGKLTSDLYISLVIEVKRCNSTLDATCASDAVYAAHLAAITRFQLTIPIIKQAINSGNKEYKEFITEDHLFFFEF